MEFNKIQMNEKLLSKELKEQKQKNSELLLMI